MEQKEVFQKGDKVFDLMVGNGVIQKVMTKSINVLFDGDDGPVKYTKDGKLNDEIVGLLRTLYHGHDLEVTVTQKLPIRNKWGNVFIFKVGTSGSVKIHDSEQKALDNINEDITSLSNATYIKTIELVEEAHDQKKK